MSKVDPNSGEYRQHRENILAHVKKITKFRPAGVTEPEAAMHHLEQAVERVKALAKPIQQAGGAVKESDRNDNLRPMVFSNLLSSFDEFDKMELMFALTAIIGDRIMNDIEADPWGRGTPDLLSGQ